MPTNDDPFQAIALAMSATLFFASSDTISKYLSSSLPIFEFIWIRYVLFVLIALVLARGQGTKPFRPNNLKLQILRGVCVSGSSVLFVYGLRSMTMAQASTIGFLSPMLVTMLSIPLLGEVVGIRRWAAVGAGLLGMLIVVRPGLQGFEPAALFAVGSSFCWAIALIITRMISTTDTAQTTVLWSAAIGAIVLSVLLPFQAVWPAPWQLALSLLMGTVASAGQWLVILAHRKAGASVLAPFFYTQIIWVTGLGFLVFGNLPDRWTLTGAGIIIASGLYTAHRERVRRIADRRAASLAVEPVGARPAVG